jgi:hypothetical protein
MKVCAGFIGVGSLRSRTPRSGFAVNEDCVSVCYTYPPDRGVWFRTQNPTSFCIHRAGKILYHLGRTRYLYFHIFCDFLYVTRREGLI